MTLVKSYSATLVMFTLFSVARAMRTVYKPVVLPGYVALQKLPSAVSFQTVINGILLLLGGPILGKYI